MEELYKQLFEKIRAAENILLLTHKNPDGDAFGSLCAIIGVLEKMGKKYTALVNNHVPHDYLFLPFVEKVSIIRSNLDSYDLIISLDVADLGYIAIDGDLEQYRNRVVNIDHHFTNNNFGALNIVQPEKSATAEIVYLAFKANKVEIDKNIATCLLEGILTDTDNFTNAAASVSSLEIASDLLLKGAKMHKIVQNSFYNKSFDRVKFWGKIFDRLITNEEYNIVIAIITEDDFSGIAEDREEVTKGMANFLSNIFEAKAIIVLEQKENNIIKGSFRTTRDDIDVSKLAKFLGGGGHKKAAGFMLNGKIASVGEGWKVV